MLIPIVYYQCVCMFNEFVCACTCFLLSCLPERKQTLVDAETRSAVRLQKSQYCKQTWLLSSYRMKYLPRRWHINIPLTRIQAVRRLNLLQFNLTNICPATIHIQTVLRWLGHRLDDRVIGVRFPVETHVAQIVSGAHQWAAGSLYSGVKQPERLADNSHLEPRLRKHGAIFLLLHTRPWQVLNQA